MAGLATPGPASAQAGEYALSLREVPVGAALEELVTLTGISLVYSSEVVRGRRTVCRTENASPEGLLRCITEGAGLDFYRLSSGTYVVIEAPEALPAFGSLSGQIVDAVTGEPVPFAQVELADGTRSARSNGAGIFLLTRLLPGPHQLLVSQWGYTPQRLPLEILAAENTRRQIRLDPTILELDPIVVEGMRGVGGGESPEGRWQGEGFGGAVPLDGEISQQARSGLGVSRRPLFADLSIQGSAPGEHAVRLDGVPVFDPVSLGRSRSAFSPLALRRITVRKAGFGVQHGSFSGGVIDVEHALSDRSGTGGITALLDPYSANGDISLPISVLGGTGTVMAAGRTSLWSIYRENALDQALRDWNQVDPVLMSELSQVGGDFSSSTDYGSRGHGSNVGFDDIHSALRLEFPGFRTLQASFYRGTNRVETELLSAGMDGAGDALPVLYLTRDRYRWSNTAGQLRLDWLLGDRASVQLRGWGSSHLLDHDYGLAETAVTPEELYSGTSEVTRDLRQTMALQGPTDDENRIQEWGAGASVDLAAGAGHFLSAGMEAVHTDSRGHLQNGFLRPLLFRDRGWRLAAFLQDRWRLTDRVTLEGGVRVTTVGSGSGYAEPRLSARVDGTGAALGPWSLKLSGGLYRQFLNQFALSNVGPSALVPEVQFWLPADGSLEPARSRHLAAEFAARPWAGWEVRGEAYYKAMDRILTLDYGTLSAENAGVMTEMAQADFVGVADGSAYGVGGRLGWEHGRARALLTYDWTVSERTFPSRFDGKRQPTPWSEPHRVTLGARLPVWGGLALEAESRNVWGRTWALRRAYYDFLAFHDDMGVLPIGLPSEDRLPDLHQLDLG
ncbi:MAG TPA: TonB-dependent receptor, partial [Longimicrobiales bacterium]|nr:TonB-dependent receptor [Longimicrobiales bacterium]